MNKITKAIRYKTQKKKISYSFSSTRLTLYSGLSPIMDYLNKLKIGEGLNVLFPTVEYNSTKYSNAQVFFSVLLSSLAGENRIKRISNFTKDSLVSSMLNLKKGLNKDVISTRIKSMGANGYHPLPVFLE